MNDQPPNEPTPGLLLHLAGPLQSWGQRSHYNERDTALFPTRSGVLGLLSSALGRRRDEPVDDLRRLSLTVRADRPGHVLRDLHTVGGGLPAKETVTTAEGRKRGTKQATLLSHRSYLQDAAFTVALTASQEDADLVHACAQALRAPRWAPYLGRRSCPPTGPHFLGHTLAPWQHLVHLPLHRTRDHTPRADGAHVLFYGDAPLDTRLPTTAEHQVDAHAASGADPSGEIDDDPRTFHTDHRSYRTRPLYRRELRLPEHRYAGLGVNYLQAIDSYLHQHKRPEDERINP
ncbi:type I-E CRISPR-associated protein Cas5/CasD [Nocardiopsis sp. SBT366]|uniref:type I-E CRISPR-associated protein Cas5/CasD n=1 Tax=Nocardiopsis sp. SBT366 TaxID=1580529 RepID=UPI00066A3E47|nr:type I-E CRISPR-associated protein Cas5/CasD [Nocardiopsis sp. SBT366]